MNNFIKISRPNRHIIQNLLNNFRTRKIILKLTCLSVFKKCTLFAKRITEDSGVVDN